MCKITMSERKDEYEKCLCRALLYIYRYGVLYALANHLQCKDFGLGKVTEMVFGIASAQPV